MLLKGNEDSDYEESPSCVKTGLVPVIRHGHIETCVCLPATGPNSSAAGP